jgi:hypothetical protein
MTVAFMGVWTRPVESRAMDWADFLLLSSFTLASKIPESSELTPIIFLAITIIRCKLGRKTIHHLSTAPKSGTRRQSTLMFITNGIITIRSLLESINFVSNTLQISDPVNMIYVQSTLSLWKALSFIPSSSPALKP